MQFLKCFEKKPVLKCSIKYKTDSEMVNASTKCIIMNSSKYNFCVLSKIRCYTLIIEILCTAKLYKTMEWKSLEGITLK